MFAPLCLRSSALVLLRQMPGEPWRLIGVEAVRSDIQNGSEVSEITPRAQSWAKPSLCFIGKRLISTLCALRRP